MASLVLNASVEIPKSVSIARPVLEIRMLACNVVSDLHSDALNQWIVLLVSNQNVLFPPRDACIATRQ
jgi:hypothetical protein